jgi:hypothetical protein
MALPVDRSTPAPARDSQQAFDGGESAINVARRTSVKDRREDRETP